MLSRFMDKVSPEPNSGCWLWMGGVSSRGYACFSVDGIQRQAHHISYLHFNGPIPEGEIVRHKCDVRSCVNPDHLLVGTYADNSKDMVVRNRQAKGEKQGIAKLSAEQVRRIRSLRGKVSQHGIAVMMGVSQPTVWRVLHGETWGHVDAG
jgi:hypothetical protein